VLDAMQRQAIDQLADRERGEHPGPGSAPSTTLFLGAGARTSPPPQARQASFSRWYSIKSTLGGVYSKTTLRSWPIVPRST
jgi:hypothetical protein